MTSPKNERFTSEESAFGIVVEIECHRISSTSIVQLLESLVADRDKLALVVRGARRFGIPAHFSWPEDTRLSVAHAVDVGFQTLIVVEGYALCKTLVGGDGSEIVAFAIGGAGSLTNQACQHLALQHFSLFGIGLYGAHAVGEEATNERGEIH